MATMTSTVHAGAKRKPEDIGDQERLAKRFDLLNIKTSHKHYLPKPNSEQKDALHLPPDPNNTSKENDLMHVESTKDRVFIHDLDAELAELESDHEHPIFLPDIEKHLNKIPPHLLHSSDPRSSLNDKQLVLYNVPQSVSLPADADSVRKAIIESRNRARLEQRAQIRRERRGEMDIEDVTTHDANKTARPVLARLKWREPSDTTASSDEGVVDDQSAHDADDEDEPMSEADAMDIG